LILVVKPLLLKLKKSYREKSKLYHPDISNLKDAKEKMQNLNEAYEILKSPLKRYSYDKECTAYNSLYSERNKNAGSSYKTQNIKDDKLFGIVITLSFIFGLAFVLYFVVLMIINDTFSISYIFIVVFFGFWIYALIMPILIGGLYILREIFRDIKYVIRRKGKINLSDLSFLKYSLLIGFIVFFPVGFKESGIINGLWYGLNGAGAGFFLWAMVVSILNEL